MEVFKRFLCSIEYCGATPECSSDAATTVLATLPVGEELFDISDLVVNRTSFSQLTYAISSTKSSLFEVDIYTGILVIRL